MSNRSATGRLHRPPHTSLSPNRQVTMRVPLILDIIGRPLKPPVGQRTTALDLSLQASTVGAELRIRPILPADLEAIVEEFVRDIARVLDDLQGQRFHLEDPAGAEGQGAAELVVVRVVDGVVAVAAVDDGVDEMAFAVGGAAGALGFVRGVVDGKAEVVDAVLVVSGGEARVSNAHLGRAFG